MIIAEEHPLTPDLELLFQRHTADMHADTPPESIHPTFPKWPAT